MEVKREIKFRVVYNGKVNRNNGWHGDCYADNEGVVTLPEEEDTIYLQYTGLKDKNGKEIYEGDLLRVIEKYIPKENAEWKTPTAVKYSGSSFVVYSPKCCKTCKDSFGCIMNLDECLGTSELVEVIGNIHENPELLKKLR